MRQELDRCTGRQSYIRATELGTDVVRSLDGLTSIQGLSGEILADAGEILNKGSGITVSFQRRDVEDSLKSADIDWHSNIGALFGQYVHSQRGNGKETRNHCGQDDSRGGRLVECKK